jgi:hypothetical protein
MSYWVGENGKRLPKEPLDREQIQCVGIVQILIVTGPP